MSYAHTITLEAPFEEAERRIRAALAEQGFGILSAIDVKATFAAKLGQGHADALGDYLILGACNPQLAERALDLDPDLGTLLPCNVVVRRPPDATATVVQAIDPQTMVTLSQSPGIQGVASEADRRLQSALASLVPGFFDI